MLFSNFLVARSFEEDNKNSFGLGLYTGANFQVSYDRKVLNNLSLGVWAASSNFNFDEKNEKVSGSSPTTISEESLLFEGDELGLTIAIPALYRFTKNSINGFGFLVKPSFLNGKFIYRNTTYQPTACKTIGGRCPRKTINEDSSSIDHKEFRLASGVFYELVFWRKFGLRAGYNYIFTFANEAGEITIADSNTKKYDSNDFRKHGLDMVFTYHF
jgi:hypothetical protein